MMDSKLMIGTVLAEPVNEESGNAIRHAFLIAGQCSCGIRYVPPGRKLRRAQWRTGNILEHVYRHADGCAGGVHTVLDVTYLKEGVT